MNKNATRNMIPMTMLTFFINTIDTIIPVTNIKSKMKNTSKQAYPSGLNCLFNLS